MLHNVVMALTASFIGNFQSDVVLSVKLYSGCRCY